MLLFITKKKILTILIELMKTSVILSKRPRKICGKGKLEVNCELIYKFINGRTQFKVNMIFIYLYVISLFYLE